jgi:hypothetical protein
LTAILAWLALRLWWPDDIFTTSGSFAPMARIAPENTWAAGIWMTSCVGVVGVVSRNRLLRFISIAVVATTHGALAFLLAKNGPGLAPGILVINALQGYYLLVRRAHAGL